jgi:polysaccharide export outer membrane protein
LAGAVVKPGLYPITNVPVTVSQAIVAADVLRETPSSNGNNKTVVPRPLADLSHVTLIRNGQRIALNLRAFYQNGDQTQDRLILPGDIVEVPDNASEQVHLIGEVVSPGNYPMNNGEVNLAQALGDAGGLNLTTANPSRIFVFRGAYEKPQVYWLDAGSPDAMLLATQFQLQPQDVVYVATAGVSSWNRVITQILPTVQALYETKVLVNP